MVSLEDRAALLLAIKEPGKAVGLDHLFEKLSRDVAFAEGRRIDKEEVKKAVEDLVARGLASKVKEGYIATERLDEAMNVLIKDKMKELNRSYVLVWLAKNYYPKVSGSMLPFLMGRPVSAVKIFSGKKNPIEEVEPIFVRYARYKPKPVLLSVDSKERLMELVFDHCIDFIPYIHRFEAKEPDVFVLDLDAGPRVLEKPYAFEFLRYIAQQLSELLSELEIEHMVKFSGSRGFQVWASFDNTSLRGRGDLFRVYREMAVMVQRKLEDRLHHRLGEIDSMFPAMVRRDRPITTSTVAHKEERADQVLVDSSILKPMGDVRAPFSIHYKTGLASLPLPREKLNSFRPDDAFPLKVLEDLEPYEKASKVGSSDPSKLLH
ncbi:MAG: hypothetical protein QW815_08880 [Nitrososphaerota archaeon]